MEHLDLTQEVWPLWQTLSEELADIFDAHFVCATVATQVAQYTKAKTLVGISDSEGQYYDVWISECDGPMTQVRWAHDKAGFEPFIDPLSSPQSGAHSDRYTGRHRALRTEKFSRPAAEIINNELWLLPRESILTVPLPHPRQSISTTPPGIICLVDPDDSCPLNEENLHTLAGMVTVHLDRAYLRQQVDRQDIEFAVISEIGHALTSTLSLQSIYNQLAGPIRRTLNVETFSIGLREPITGDIIFVEVLLGPQFEKLPPIRLKRGQGLGGWVAENGEPVIINDTYSDQRFFSHVDQLSGFRTRSMICIPLQVEQRTIGVLQAINRLYGKFTDHDLRLLQAIGAPLAAAIENANLHSDVIAEKRRIETIFANMSEGLLTINATAIITHVNEAMLSLVVSESHNVIGRHVSEVIRLKTGSLDDFLQQVLTAIDENPQLAADLQRASSRTVPVLISGAPIRKNDGSISELILVFSDLTQIREVERMRDDFFHGIIHELRTPLATILMYARLLREGKVKQVEKEERFLGVIERESDRLQKMVRQMLELAKREVRELQRSSEPVLLNPVFEDSLPPLADQAIQKGLLFRQRIQPDLPAVMGSSETLHMILKNVVENAIKFTMSGTVQITAEADNGDIRIEVKDEGIGIPAEAMPNLYKRFYRTQTAVERGIAGSGLGLYMVKQSLENYNGTINVNSELGQGTTFTIRIPTIQT